MTYFADNTPYAYSPKAAIQWGLPVVNIGWLTAGRAFRRGLPESQFVRALEACATRPEQLYRGLYGCEFCRRAYITPYQLENGRSPQLGNGEIRVRGDDVVFAAPTLVLHYVVEHGYSPPQPFCRAAVERAAGLFVVDGADRTRMEALDPQRRFEVALQCLEEMVRREPSSSSKAVVERFRSTSLRPGVPEQTFFELLDLVKMVDDGSEGAVVEVTKWCLQFYEVALYDPPDLDSSSAELLESILESTSDAGVSSDLIREVLHT